MINTLGNGVDIVENKRIFWAIKNEKFINKVYSKEEIKLSKRQANKTNYFAKRYAAKEAFLKAIGTGLRYGAKFKDISIKNNKLGKPFIKLNVNLKKMILKKFKIKKFEIHLSLSDEKKHSIAFVILNAKKL
tara:strand:- start:3077 stop:3472 length:396 start_codon:yes stop_codon:yes gene_type:complete